MSHWVQEPTLLTEFWARLCRRTIGLASEARFRRALYPQMCTFDQKKNRFRRRKRAMSILFMLRRLHCIMDSSRSRCSDICISVHLICRKKAMFYDDSFYYIICIAIVGELQDVRLTQLFTQPSIAIAKPIRTHFETRAEGNLHFWECPSKAEWFIHAEVHKKRLPGCATQPRNGCKLHATC